MNLKIGDRVKLPANEKEDWPEEFGTIFDILDEIFAYVDIDEEFKQSSDGIREIYINENFIVKIEG